MLAVDVYIPVLVVFMCIMPSVGAIWKFVEFTHCRNRVLAGAAGLAFGLTGYLAYYHLDECIRWDVPWSAVDRLPEYIAFRMDTDEWKAAHRGVVILPRNPVAGVRPAVPLANVDFFSFHWLVLAIEATLAAGFPLAVGIGRASRPYSETRGQRCVQETLLVGLDTGRELQTALLLRTVSDWVASNPRRVSADQKHCRISVWYTPSEREQDPDADVYLSIDRSAPIRLEPEETAAFVRLLPSLQDLAGPALADLAKDADASADPTSARVWDVPPPFAGMAQNPRNRFIGRCLLWGLLFVPVLPLAALVGGTYLLAVGQNPVNVPLVVGYAIGMGFFSIFFTVRWLSPEWNMHWRLTVAFDRHLLRRAIASRPSPLVDHSDSRAIFAEMCPRRHWNGPSPANGEYNQGLMLVDGNERVIRFEGDYQRYWIPADSILACTVEALGGMGTTAAMFAVVLQVRIGSGVWEFPFVPLANIEGNIHWERSMWLLSRIEGMTGHSFGQQPPRPIRAEVPVV